MKKSLKITFYLISLVLILGIFFNIKKLHPIDQVRIAYSLNRIEESSIDPASINTLDQALIVDNIYSHLVEYDEDGNLQAGIAKKFYWEGDTLVFEFEKKSKTKSGYYINAEDAAISIRRLLILGTSTHSDLNFFLCKSKTLKNPFQNCESIYTQNEKLYIKALDKRFKPYLLTTLASDDFAIIPKEAIDPKSLAITNKKITSGPYYIESSNSDKWVLKSNENHYALTPQSPREVLLISTENESASDLLIADKVDIISTYNSISAKKLNDIEKKITKFSVEKTLGIKLYYLQFSPAAQKKTTAQQRASIANKFRKIMEKKFPISILYENTNTFFLDQSLGKLKPNQKKDLEDYLSSNLIFPDNLKLTFHVQSDSASLFSMFSEIEELKLVETEESPFEKPIDQRLDIFLSMTDTSFEGNLSLLGYNFNMGTFGLNRDSGNTWINNYLDLNEPESRALMLQDLQYKALINGVIFPLFKAPYTSIGRNGFSMPLSPLFASSHFWKIIKQ